MCGLFVCMWSFLWVDPTGKYHRLLTLVILFSGYLVSRGTHAPECRLQRGCRPKLHQDSKRQSVDEAKISGVERLCKILLTITHRHSKFHRDLSHDILEFVSFSLLCLSVRLSVCLCLFVCLSPIHTSLSLSLSLARSLSSLVVGIIDSKQPTLTGQKLGINTF